MLRILKWAFWIVFWAVIATFFHYTLPQYDVVRITDTYEKRVDFGANSIFWANSNSGEATGRINRDVFFIQSVRPNGRPSVYRNEDTAFSWPPYFKFDTSNLQARANDLRSTEAAPVWVAIKHYGWRVQMLSTFPNALSLKVVAGPDARPINWTTIVVLTLFALLVWGVWSRLNRFWDNRIDPLLDDAGDSLRDAHRNASGWWSSWTGGGKR